MRRSTLQRKDRDELTQIATTLGKKPSSRARKGEIIDLILDLAAVVTVAGSRRDRLTRHRCHRRNGVAGHRRCLGRRHR